MTGIPLSPLHEWTRLKLGVGRLTRPAIEDWQLQRLREVVSWARTRSPFYGRLYADLVAAPLETMADLARLPFVTGTDLRERGLDLLCVSQGDISRVVTLPTSGTTGAPKRLFFTEEDLELTIDHFHHGMKALVQTGQRVMVLMPGERPGTVGALMRAAMERSGVETIVYGFVDDPARVAEIIQAERVDCLVGVPGQVLALARSQGGRLLGRRRVRSVLLSGDYVARPLREALEHIWGCDVFEHYGTTEMGLGGAVQCRAFAGRHIREADLLLEVIDPGSGRVLADGERGEIVLTTLTRKGMPLIRYRTGDEASILQTPCPCGSLLRSLDKVRGRLGERVDLGGDCLLSMEDIDEALLGLGWVMRFTVAVGPGERDVLVIEVEPAGDVPSDAEEIVVRAVRGLPAVPDGMGIAMRLVGLAGEAGAAKRRIEDRRLMLGRETRPPRSL